MGVVSIMPVIAAVSGGACCALLVPRALVGMRDFATRTAVRARMRQVPGSGAFREGKGVRDLRGYAISALTICLESGIPSLRRPARWLSARWLVSDELDRLVSILRQRGIQATKLGTCQTLLALECILFAVVLLVTGSWLSSLLAVVLAGVLLHARAARSLAAMVSRSNELVPDAMRALAVYYGSGLTLVQSFEHAASEVPAPLGPRLGEVAVSMKAGMSAADALARLRGGGEDARPFTFASIALEIQHATGAPMKPLLEDVAASVSASLRLKRSLEVQTAQARLSAKIVSVMPVAVVALMALVNPSYLTGFLASPVGLVMFIVACLLELVGILAIRKILDVEVG